MTDEEIKEKIQKVADEKYKGGYRHLKPKILQSIIGQAGVKRLYDKLDPLLRTSYSLATFCFMNDILENPKCPCGNHTKFNTTTKLFLQYCSNKCKWDNNNKIQETKKNTCMAKYGAVNVLSSDYGKQKILETNVSKYGVTNYTKTEEYKQRVRGRKSSPETVQRIQESHRKIFYKSLTTRFPNFTPLFTLEEYRGVKGYIEYDWICKTCNKEFISSIDNGSSPTCTHCKPIGTKHELLIRDFLDSVNIKYEYNFRKILPSKKEIDVYIPSLKLGIELCGLRWHSTYVSHYGKMDHLAKQIECDEQGIRLITIFDDEIFQKKQIVLNRIKSNLGLIKRKIYARKCEVVNLSPDICKRFLEKYHIQGYIGGKYRYGLKYKNKIVAIMTFNKGRLATGNTDKDNVYELGRYCTVANFSVIGGAGKLFQHFVKQVNPDEIFSYCDRRWNTGKVYEQIGMTFVKNTVPNYYYTKDFKSRLHRMKFQKNKLTNMPSYDEGLTEEEILKLEKYYRVWDCGSKLFHWKPKS